MLNLCDPRTIRQVMDMFGINFKKEYGQNFLIRREIPARIAEECTENEESMILEIGPGIGCLTKELAERYAKVVSVEIDSHLLPILAKTLAEYDNVTVVNQDVMKVDLGALRHCP